MTIEVDGCPPGGAAARRRPLAVLAVISAAGNAGITRDRLLGFFWPESSEERARNTFKQTLYALRRDLGDGELRLGTKDLHVNPERLTSDVAEFERAALASWDIAAAREAFARRSSPTAATRATTLAQGSAPTGVFRLAITDIRMRLKLGQYDEVRTRGDTLLRVGRPPRSRPSRAE